MTNLKPGARPSDPDTTCCRKTRGRGPIMTLLRAAILTVGMAAMAAPAQAEKIFISNEQDNPLSVIDAESLEVIDTIEVGRRPRAMTLSNEGDHLFVAVGDDEAVDVVDVESHEV